MPADGQRLHLLAFLLSGLLLLGGRSLGSFRGSVRSICDRFARFDLLAHGCELTDEGITSLALPFQRELLLGGRSLGSLQSFFSFGPRISQGCNASRQSSDILSGRCQLTGENFNLLALLLSGLLLLGGRCLGIFRGSVRSICDRFARFDLLARGCELTDEGIASLALSFQREVLLGGRSLGSLQSFFSFSPRISQGCNASRQSSGILSGRCQLTGENFNLLALLLSGLLLLGGRSLGIVRGSVRRICARALTSSRADASSRMRASPRWRSCSITRFCSAAEAWAVCKAFSASVRASVRAVTRAVKVPTSSRADAS